MNKLLSIACTICALKSSIVSSTKIQEKETRNLRALASDDSLRILIPDFPDPEPSEKLWNLATIDPTPLNASCPATSQLESIIPRDGTKIG